MSQRRTWVFWMAVVSSSLASGCAESASTPADGSGVPIGSAGGATPEDAGAEAAASGAIPPGSAGTDSGGAPRDAESEAAETLVLFADPATGFTTREVHDADREIVYFDAERSAMISASSGDAVSGWTTLDNDLRWSRSGVAFRVRFGTEDGVRRAYFTETGNGTICNLTLSGPDTLGIRATAETPPNP
jgi:hypothetical protein